MIDAKDFLAASILVVDDQNANVLLLTRMLDAGLEPQQELIGSRLQILLLFPQQRRGEPGRGLCLLGLAGAVHRELQRALAQFVERPGLAMGCRLIGGQTLEDRNRILQLLQRSFELGHCHIRLAVRLVALQPA